MSTGRSTTTRDQHRRAIRRTKPPCGICEGEIDYTLHYLDPMAYVVDHIVPLAKGGLDELANKQAAHRRPGPAIARSPTSCLRRWLLAPSSPPGPGDPQLKQADPARLQPPGSWSIPQEGINMHKATAEAERFWAKVDKAGNHWLWMASTSANGYGKFDRADGRRVMAHRVAYELSIGPIPNGLHIDHLCRVRLCCNPDHLEAVTQAENNRRAAAFVTTCKHGHDFTEANVYVTPDGRRQCRTCIKERLVKSEARRRAA